MADDQSQVPPAQPAPAAAAAAPQAAPPPQTAATPAEKAKRSGQRRRLFAILGVVLVVLAVGYFFYWLLVASHYVSTDNAYVGADVAQVTPLVSGAVTDVRGRRHSTGEERRRAGCDRRGRHQGRRRARRCAIQSGRPPGARKLRHHRPAEGSARRPRRRCGAGQGFAGLPHSRTSPNPRSISTADKRSPPPVQCRARS